MPNVPKVRYLKWRDGRPRWEPGPGARKLGFPGVDLKDPAGQWLDYPAAIAQAEQLNGELDATRTAGRRRRKPRAPRQARTCRDLISRWMATPEFRMLAPKTRLDYAEKIEIWLATFGDAPVAAISRKHLKAWWRHAYDTRGHHQANGVIAVARAALTYAVDEEWIAANPAFRLRLKQPPPRLELWPPEAVEVMIATADAIGQQAIGHAVVIALHTGQRQGDVLALPDRLFEAETIALRQFKRGALVDIPMTDHVRARVAMARDAKRHAARIGGPLIVRPDGTPYTKDSFTKAFRRVRNAAGLTGLRFQDLRDTAVTRLALAGCTMPEIGSITGHSQQTIHSVMKHYLALDSAMARAAISKLQAWMEKEGIAV